MLVVTATVSIVSVEAWRIKVFNFFFHQNDTHSDVKLNETPPEGESSAYQIHNIAFDYIPNGFIPEVRRSEPDNMFIRFKNESQYFSFTLQKVNGSLSIDTEGAEVKQIILNDQDALLSINGSVVVLVWHKDELA